MNTLNQPGKKTSCEQKVIFQDFNGKTVVDLRCSGAHWDCMWLMHRTGGDFSMGRARERGKERKSLLFLVFIVLIVVLLFFFVVAVKELVEMLLEVVWF